MLSCGEGRPWIIRFLGAARPVDAGLQMRSVVISEPIPWARVNHNIAHLCSGQFDGIKPIMDGQNWAGRVQRSENTLAKMVRRSAHADLYPDLAPPFGYDDRPI